LGIKKYTTGIKSNLACRLSAAPISFVSTSDHIIVTHIQAVAKQTTKRD
jgi:hypothetical protein